jgi:AcrR family transcriptional regulator
MIRRPSASKRPPAARLKLVRREYLGEIARSHILDAAEQVLAEKGLGATIKEIADRADFSAGAIYGFFASKDEIVARVFERHEAAFLDAMRAAAGAQESAHRRIHLLFDAQIDYFKTHPNFYKLFDQVVRSRSWALQFTGTEQSSVWYRRALEIQAEVFRTGMASGELIEGDPVVQAAILSGIIAAYISHWVFQVAGKGDSDIDRVAPVSQIHALLDRAFAINRGAGAKPPKSR